MPDDAAYGLPYWDDRDWPEAWDTLVLGEDTWPGMCEVSGAGVSRKIDVKKAKDQDGATLKDEGYQPARFTVTVTIFTGAQWLELQRLLAKVHPRKAGGTRNPLEIFNPQVNFLGVTQIYIDKISIPKKPSAGDGLMSVDLSAIEWCPAPKPAPAQGKAVQASDDNTETNGTATLEDLQNELTSALLSGDAEAVEFYGNMINNTDFSE